MVIGSMTLKRAVLKLVHPGGIIEAYNKPITAAEIMKKYPRHCVTRPDVFKNPWVVVRPESVLRPGDVFYVVPYHTIHRLLQSKECPKLLTYPEEAGGSGVDERTFVQPYNKAGAVPQKREKIDCPSWQFFRDELESCSYSESSVEALHSHQLVRRRSPNCDKYTENRKLVEYRSGVMSSKKKFSQQFIGKKASENDHFLMGSEGHREGREFRNGHYRGHGRHPHSAERPEDPYELSAEINRLHRILKGLSLNRESSKQCQADRDDIRPEIHGETNSKKHSPDHLIDQRSEVDFTFHPTNPDPSIMEESSPDLAPFQCLPKRRYSAEAHKDTKNYKFRDCRRGNSALKLPLKVGGHPKELAPKKQDNDQFIDKGSYSSAQLGTSGNGDVLKKQEIHSNEFPACDTKCLDLVPVTSLWTDVYDSHANSAKLKSCIKKSGLRLRNARVKFNLPGEDKELRIQIFEF